MLRGRDGGELLIRQGLKRRRGLGSGDRTRTLFATSLVLLCHEGVEDDLESDILAPQGAQALPRRESSPQPNRISVRKHLCGRPTLLLSLGPALSTRQVVFLPIEDDLGLQGEAGSRGADLERGPTRPLNGKWGSSPAALPRWPPQPTQPQPQLEHGELKRQPISDPLTTLNLPGPEHGGPLGAEGAEGDEGAEEAEHRL